MPAVLTTPPPPLSPQQLRTIADSRLRMKRIRRAISVGRFDAWTIAVFGALTFLGGLFSPLGLLLGAALCVIAWVEFKACDKLKALDPTAARTLGYNQMALGGLLITYAAWNLMSPSTLSSGVLTSAAELKAAGIDIEAMQQRVNQLLYSSLIVVALCAQGSLALFHFRRAAMVRDYVRQTPPWIVQLQHAGMAV